MLDEQAYHYLYDTLTHLESLSSVQSLLLSVERALLKVEKLILTFRDYVSVEPNTGTQRLLSSLSKVMSLQFSPV